MKTIYISNDGKFFDTIYDCQDYENSIKISKAISDGELKLITNDFKVLTTRDFLDYTECARQLGSVYFFCCTNKDVLQILDTYYDTAGWFDTNTYYFYDEMFETWRRLDDEIISLKKTILKLTNIKNLLSLPPLNE